MIDNKGLISTNDLINNIYSFMKNLSHVRQTGENANNLFNYNAAEDIVNTVFKDIQN